MQILDEITVAQARSQAEPKRVQRSLNLPTGSRFQGIDREGNLLYNTQSQTRPGLIHRQRIFLVDLPLLMAIPDDDFTFRDRIIEAIWGDLKCECSCEDYGFGGFRYILTTLNSVLGDEEHRRPDIRNPRLIGRGCKHLVNCIRILPANQMQIISALRR